jgi:uncharacterized membrane protein YvlD (DUF360 family)
MLGGFLRFAITAAAIPLCAKFMDGVSLINMENAILLGVILAVGYTLLRPLVRLLLSVINFCTLGILYVLVDAWLVQAAASLVNNSVTFDSFWWALAVSLVINLGRTAVDVLTDKKR